MYYYYPATFNLWAVAFNDRDGINVIHTFVGEYQAAALVNYLNGGNGDMNVSSNILQQVKRE